MSWNFRIVVKDRFYGIHEVYYAEDGSIKAATENPVAVGGSAQSFSELKEEYERMGEALSKPPVLFRDIGESR